MVYEQLTAIMIDCQQLKSVSNYNAAGVASHNATADSLASQQLSISKTCRE